MRWDNINMYNNAGVVAAVQNAGAVIIGLPRYRPDFKPTETALVKER